MKIQKTDTVLFFDLVENTLKLSENPGELGRYLTEHIRELIGCRAVILYYFEDETVKLLDVCPQRRRELAKSKKMMAFSSACKSLNNSTIINQEEKNTRILAAFRELGIEQSIYISLHIGDEKIGALILHDLFTDIGNKAVLVALENLAGVIALTLKNALSFQNLEEKVKERTKELKAKNDEYAALNEEYFSQNEDLLGAISRYEESEDALLKAKEKAEESEKKLIEAQELSHVGSWEYNIETDEVIWSKELHNIFERSYDLPAPKYSEQAAFYTKESFKKLDRAFQNSIEQEIPFEVELDILTSSGLLKHIISKGAVKKDQNNKIIGSYGTAQDITKQKKLQLELISAKEKAEEGDQLKTSFLQNISHEIRTPLNAISGFSGLLTNPNLLREKRDSYVSIIQNSSAQLVSIVNDVLTISSLETKQEKVTINQVCINNVIVELLSIFQQQAQHKNISINTKQPLNNKQSKIYTDRTKIVQVLSNFLSNAIKFTHKGFIEFGYNLKDSELEFYVKDSGIGIKQEFHEKIFDRFRQADVSTTRKYGGTGLGLSISKGFVELLGGKIWIDSEPGKGSTFYFTIPYKPAPETDQVIIPAKRNKDSQTILVAEDEENNFLYLQELLLDLNYKTVHAKDGQEAVKIAASNPNISLILMDIKMPEMDGYTAAKLIKKQNPELPIIAQSAYALDEEIKKYSEIFDDYITKPIQGNALAQLVSKYSE